MTLSDLDLYQFTAGELADYRAGVVVPFVVKAQEHARSYAVVRFGSAREHARAIRDAAEDHLFDLDTALAVAAL